MSMESDLTALLKALCPQVYPDVAPTGAQRPYVTYQAIGGRSMRLLDGGAGDKRRTTMQINVWAESRAQALQLVRAIEDAMAAATVFVARPVAEPISEHDGDLGLYGSIQEFSILSSR